MAVGKREQIVGLSIAVLVSIFLIHLLIFKPKADEYADVKAEFSDGVSQLTDAEIATPVLLSRENTKTANYRDQVTSVVSQLNLEVPQYFVNNTMEDYLKRYDDHQNLMKELVRMKSTVRQPQLTFLGDRRLPQNPWEQLGWNLPAQLPMLERATDKARVKAQLWDLVDQLQNHWTVANNISDPRTRMQYRVKYNELLIQLGLNPAELSDFIYRPDQNTAIFFNDKRLYESFGAQAQINPLSINRYGVFLPDIKKMWMLELIWEQHDPSIRITREKLNEVLEVNLPLDERMLFFNRQLQALIDVIKLAEKANIQEISEVRMMKPTDFGKVTRREPGKPEPAPDAADPDAMGAPDATASAEKVAKGSGLEIYFRGTNPSTFDFLFEVGTMPRTYALDDLYIQAAQGSMLYTSATIEMVMRLETANSSSEMPAAE